MGNERPGFPGSQRLYPRRDLTSKQVPKTESTASEVALMRWIVIIATFAIVLIGLAIIFTLGSRQQ